MLESKKERKKEAVCSSCMFSPFTFCSVSCILKSLGNGNREIGTCCWPASTHICNYDTPGSHNRPWDSQSFDLQILRGALHAEPKIKYWFTGFGSEGKQEKRWWWWGLVSLFQQSFFGFPSV